MKKIKLLLAAFAAMVTMGVNAQSWTAPTIMGEDPVSGKVYRIYNVGAGMYLNGGKAWFSWSTTAVLSSTALNETFTGNASSFTLQRADGKYVFTSGNGINGDAMHVDGASSEPNKNYGITKLDNGNYRIHDAGGDGSSCWGHNSSISGNNTTISNGIVAHANPAADGWNCEWLFLTENSDAVYQARLALYNWYLDATDKGVSADAYKTVYDNSSATVDELNAASASLKQDILEALVAAGNYPVDVTKYTLKNPDFTGTFDGWTKETPYGGNCGLKDNVAMEYWAGNASDRAKACFNIYQELTNLPNGVYTVSADMYNSLNSEGGNYTVFSPTCGVYGSASNEEVALCDVEGTTLNTYTTNEVLVFRGRIVVGVKNTTTPMAARWFLFDNVKLNYARQLTDDEIAANTVPESVSLDQTDVALTIYGSTTLEPTVLPANAGDKSITWTSSDESVATVSNGLVVAVGIGTATITATANGADGVSATANITVSDVTPVAAPAFYSELAAGDFYIVNAATGKFLGGANSWGTQASQIEHGIPFTVAIGDGVYTLDSHTYNNANDHFFSGTYVDGSSTNLYITSVGDGKYTISTANGSAYVTAKPGTTIVDNSSASGASVYAQWYFVSKTNRDKTLVAATAENPVDATYYIKEANISRNLRVAYNTTGWTGDKAYGGNNENQCVERYCANTNVYQEINVPNGTYKVKVQGFYRQESGDAVSYLYANDQEEPLTQIYSGGINDMAGASTAFSKGEYTTELEVTVTDRTLRVGVKCDAATNWTIFDNFELYLKSYAPVTAIAAELDKDEIQIGQTATITTTSTPAAASFNAVTSYSSSDENVATVDENGVVTGVAVGTATITINANEMESNSTTVDVTVTLVVPTSIALSDTEVALDKETTSATLNVIPAPAGANDAVIWTTSDASVATVVGGVVTAVSSGTATITATSAVAPEVSAEATINVTFPESSYEEVSYANNGATRTVTTLGENLIKNGSFEYPEALYGWTAKNTYSEAASASNFSITSTGGVNDGAYITTSAGGGGAATTLSRAIPVEAGKKYYFAVYTSGKAPDSNNFQYNALFKLNNSKSEDGKMKEFAWPQGAGNTTSEWSKTEYVFTADADHPYVGVRMSWNASSKFDNFVLAEILSEEEIGNVQYALDAIPTENIGEGAFQYSQDAIDAANDLVQGEASVQDVEDAYAALTTINEPVADQLFNVILTYGGWTYDQKAMTYLAGDRNDMGRYNIKYQAAANTNLAQAFTFTKVSGNNYKMSQIDADGNVRYLSTGKAYEGGNTGQIRTTTDASKALVVTVIPTATEGKWNLKNTEADNYIGSQDAGVYTVNSHIDFNIVETTKPSITINTTAAGWGTVILPFAVAELPEGVKAYSVSNLKADQKELDLEEVYALEANKPYIIEGAWEDVLTGDAQGTALSYNDGMLTGVYTNTPAIVDTYVLQKQDDVVGFYQVETEGITTVKANHAYLTVPNAGVKAFFFGGETAIKSVFDGVAAGEIYDLNGTKVEKMQKGKAYIVNGTTVIVK